MVTTNNNQSTHRQASLAAIGFAELFSLSSHLAVLAAKSIPCKKPLIGEKNDPNSIIKEYDTDQGMNLDYFGSRYYDPEVGIWISTDPVGQFYNPYSYTTNPIMFVDPNGEEFSLIALGIAIVASYLMRSFDNLSDGQPADKAFGFNTTWEDWAGGGVGVSVGSDGTASASNGHGTITVNDPGNEQRQNQQYQQAMGNFVNSANNIMANRANKGQYSNATGDAVIMQITLNQALGGKRNLTNNGLGFTEGIQDKLKMYYHQASGNFIAINEATNAIVSDVMGYSGYRLGCNDPEMQQVRNVGPIPTGSWTVGATAVHGTKMGSYAIPVTPDHTTRTYDRSGFYIHEPIAKLL